MTFKCKLCGKEVELPMKEAAIALAYAKDRDESIYKLEFTCEECECRA